MQVLNCPQTVAEYLPVPALSHMVCSSLEKKSGQMLVLYVRPCKSSATFFLGQEASDRAAKVIISHWETLNNVPVYGGDWAEYRR